MNSKTHRLASNLGELTPRALRKMETTLLRNTPILVGRWSASVNGKKCGCLMMDGHAGRSREGKTIQQFLADLYQLPRDEDAEYTTSPLRTDLIDDAADAFDAWARECAHRTRDVERRGNHGDVTVLTGRGRRECLAIVQRVLRQKEATA